LSIIAQAHFGKEPFNSFVTNQPKVIRVIQFTFPSSAIKLQAFCI